MAAARTQPVATSPPKNPAATSMMDSASRRTMRLPGVGSLTDDDPARGTIAGFGYRDREHAVLQVRGHAIDVDRLRQREGAREAAVSALDAVELLARNLAPRSGGARAADRDAALF